MYNSLLRNQKIENTKQMLLVAQIIFFLKVMVLFAVPDVKDASSSSNISQPNTSSAFKLFFGDCSTTKTCVCYYIEYFLIFCSEYFLIFFCLPIPYTLASWHM